MVLIAFLPQQLKELRLSGALGREGEQWWEQVPRLGTGLCPSIRRGLETPLFLLQVFGVTCACCWVGLGDSGSS